MSPREARGDRMAAEGTNDRVLVAYKYVNHGITGRFHAGILWLDSESKQVVWQIGDDATQWHGSYEMSEHQLKVRFDALADTRGEIGPQVNAWVHK